MSQHEAEDTGNCTRCFGCCYLALENDMMLMMDENDDTPIRWYHVPIFDGAFEFLTICHFTIIGQDLNPVCLIQENKPKLCSEYGCWNGL